MDDPTASVERNYIENSQQNTVFSVPALTKGMARRRVRLAARVKGLQNPQIGAAEELRDSGNPGQKVYEVTVISGT